MNNEVLLFGVIVGSVNYLFRYLPLRLRAGYARPVRHSSVSVPLDTIGIASVCVLLIVSSVPEILADAHRLTPTLIGFLMLGATFWKTCNIIAPALLSALAYGPAWKVASGLQVLRINFSQ